MDLLYLRPQSFAKYLAGEERASNHPGGVQEQEPIRHRISLREFGMQDAQLRSWFDERILTPTSEGILELSLEPHDSVCIVATRNA